MSDRIIKFRAWDGKRMIVNPPISTYDAGVNDEFYYAISNQSKLKFMQFTGLLDKNGKEIYEGDIVKRLARKFDFKQSDGKPYDEEEISFITYSDHGFWVHDEDFGYEGEGLWDWEDMEVIGNIFEHPELKQKLL